MTILYTETYEREGNDSWLIDKIQIIIEDGELILRHKVNHKGWNGSDKYTKELSLDECDNIEEKQEWVKNYMENNFLTPEMKIPDLKLLISND